jgi:hypothetical protein
MMDSHDKTTLDLAQALRELVELHRKTYELSPEGRAYLKELDAVLVKHDAQLERSAVKASEEGHCGLPITLEWWDAAPTAFGRARAWLGSEVAAIGHAEADGT